VQDAPGVREVDRFGDGLDIARRAPCRQRLISHELREVRPIDEIHREIMLALVNADFVNGHDVRMPQTRRRRGFDAKPMDEFFARILAKQQQLDRHNSVEAGLSRFVDNAHAAARDFLQQLVITEMADVRIEDARGRFMTPRVTRRGLFRRKIKRTGQGAARTQTFGQVCWQRRAAFGTKVFIHHNFCRHAKAASSSWIRKREQWVIRRYGGSSSNSGVRTQHSWFGNPSDLFSGPAEFRSAPDSKGSCEIFLPGPRLRSARGRRCIQDFPR
jgi:hypothetical protein